MLNPILLMGIAFVIFVACLAVIDWLLFPWPSALAWRLDRLNTFGEMIFKAKWRQRR